MKKLLVLLLVLGACRSAPRAPAGMAYGAESPRAAVEAFLGAIRAGDLQAISTVWGNENGTVVGQMERDEIEKRELIFQSCFNHDKSRILEQVPATEPRYTAFRTELTRGALVRTPWVSTVEGPEGRWYVVDAEIAAVMEFCQDRTTPTPPLR